MGRIWVLDTETKGTGAEMVPLEKVLRTPAEAGRPVVAPPRRREREPEPPAPAPPRRFRITDVMTGALIGDDLDARATVEALRRARSSVDVTVYVFEPDEQRWRLLTLREQRALWALRDRAREPRVQPPPAGT
jgi:hypothetical protein